MKKGKDVFREINIERRVYILKVRFFGGTVSAVSLFLCGRSYPVSTVRIYQPENGSFR